MQKQAFRQYANRSAIHLQKIAIAILYDAQVFGVNTSGGPKMQWIIQYFISYSL